MALAPFARRRARVLDNATLGAYRVLHVADPGPPPDAGQFAMLATAERWGGGEDERPHLPRAFSYARWRDGEAHFLLEDVGPGTHRLCELAPGEDLLLLGPLGKPFRSPATDRRAILVGGGVGIAPLAILQDTLAGQPATSRDEHGLAAEPAAQRDAHGRAGQPATPSAERSLAAPHDGEPGAVMAAPTVLLGFRDRARAMGADLLTGARVATDDGSLGHDGLVTELLAAELARWPSSELSRAAVYACGPAPMLEAVRALCAEHAVPAQLALEAGMACGFGACHGCVVPRRDGTFMRVCVDGPVVDAADLAHVDAHAGAPA
jgi:dihydroorotate dehydrogenase electron transfer subunit